jgi:hypothetical protein
MVRADSTMMGTGENSRILRITTCPSRSGSPRSASTASGLWLRASTSARAAVAASTTR